MDETGPLRHIQPSGCILSALAVGTLGHWHGRSGPRKDEAGQDRMICRFAASRILAVLL